MLIPEIEEYQRRQAALADRLARLSGAEILALIYYATAEAASAARYAEWPLRPDIEVFIERYLERLSEPT